MQCQLCWETAGVSLCSSTARRNTNIWGFLPDLPDWRTKESQQLCCLHLSLPFFFPAMQNLLKSCVFSVLNYNYSDQRGNPGPLLCTVHFSLAVCVTILPVMASSPFLNTTESGCPKLLSLGKKVSHWISLFVLKGLSNVCSLEGGSTDPHAVI